MIGPKLQPWQRPAHATAEQQAWLAGEFANQRHVPARTCLGCGGSGPDHWYAQCHGWGAAAWRSISKPEDEFRVEEFRLSWAEIQRLSAAEGVQQELAL